MAMHLNKIVQGVKFAKSYLIKLGMPYEKNKNIFKKPKKRRDNKKGNKILSRVYSKLTAKKAKCGSVGSLNR